MSLIDYWKSYTLKCAVNNSADAWVAVSQETFKKAWNKLWPETEQNISESPEMGSVYQEVVEESTVASCLDETDIGDWLLCDTNEECYRLLDDDEIIEMATETEIMDRKPRMKATSTAIQPMKM